MTGKEVRRWADEAMFTAQPMQVDRTEDGGIIPKVHLLWMTADPLGAMASMYRMYEGKVIYDLADITDEERVRAFTQVQKTHLKAPLECIEMQFIIEGVTRSFTHQMVRQRVGAVYAQESMRFAVKEEALRTITSLPPSLAGTRPTNEGDWMSMPNTDKHQRWREAWDETIDQIDHAYRFLIADGMPAEDARGLMPHAVTTRINYKTNLLALSHHAGNRLCTQAQFEWRLVIMGIVKAIREYGIVHAMNAWQFRDIADSAIFRPICYQLGHCTFGSDIDRACSIRERVDAFESRAVPSTEWDKDYEESGLLSINKKPLAWARAGVDPPIDVIPAIRPEEWLLDPESARNTSGGAGHD